MLKKFKVIKTGVFLHPTKNEMPAPQPVPVGAVFEIHLPRGKTKLNPRVVAWLHFGQIEQVADDVEVTFGNRQ